MHGVRQSVDHHASSAGHGVVTYSSVFRKPLPIIVGHWNSVSHHRTLSTYHIRGWRRHDHRCFAHALLRRACLEIPQTLSQMFLMGGFRELVPDTWLLFVNVGKVRGRSLGYGQRPGVSWRVGRRHQRGVNVISTTDVWQVHVVLPWYLWLREHSTVVAWWCCEGRRCCVCWGWCTQFRCCAWKQHAVVIMCLVLSPRKSKQQLWEY